MDASRFQAVAIAADAEIDEGWEMHCWVCQGFPLGNVSKVDVAEVGRSQKPLSLENTQINLKALRYVGAMRLCRRYALHRVTEYLICGSVCFLQ